jgi:hypothetical protein
MMINDSNFKYAISNLGWVDKGNLWIYSSDKNDVESIKFSDAQYLSIHKGDNDYFSVGHNFNDSKFEITVHHFSNPTKIVCRLSFNNFKNTVIGETNILSHVPKYYIANLKINNEFRFHLFRIDNGQLSTIDDKINWYYQGNFDFGYQGLIGVTEYKDELIFCVQRDGSLYRYSLISDEIIEKITLANKYGNPRVTFCEDFSELWVDDYDTLLKINPKNWKVENNKLLQDADKGTGQFIGSYSINNDSVVIPRPYSSDILILDKNLNIKISIKVESQPLEAILLKKVIVGRDWQTGKLIIEEINGLLRDNKSGQQEVTGIQKFISWLKRKSQPTRHNRP